MAYSVHSITSISEIPALWAAFAASNGWIVDTSVSGAPTIKHPTYTGAIPFRMRAAVSGQNHDITVDSTNAVVTNASVTRSPILNPLQVTNGQAAVLPTKVHFIGRSSGSPFVVTIIEYGFNLYRHIYVGYMEKSSSYEGGEVISGSNFHPVLYSYGTYDGTSRECQSTPFSYRTSDNLLTALEVGGVRILHANNPTPWRRFFVQGYGNADINQFANGSQSTTIIGGWLDGVNTGYGISGKSNYTLSAVVAPINLLITKYVAGQCRFQQVGRPTGVRLINMEDFEPGQQVTVGSKTYMVFPIFSKKSNRNFTISQTPSSSSRFPPYETSYFYGHAYELN